MKNKKHQKQKPETKTTSPSKIPEGRVRWDRRVSKWGLLKPGALCDYANHFDYGIMTDCTLSRAKAPKRGCAPSDLVGYAEGKIASPNDISWFTKFDTGAVLTMRKLEFNGTDFYCGFTHVTHASRLLLFQGGLCLATIQGAPNA
jgi:hypothetical protein